MEALVAKGTNRLASKFFWIGNHPCLDFLNTKLMGRDSQSVDLLVDLSGLITWLVEARILGKAQGKAFLGRWGGDPETQQALEQARRFRTILRQALEKVRKRKPFPQSALGEINKRVSTHSGSTELVRTRNGFTERFRLKLTKPMHLVSAVAKTAIDLLCHCDLSLIKRCENARCVLYFYDTTKNHRRRWCSMRICGNRMKVAAFHQRRRERGSTLRTMDQ